MDHPDYPKLKYKFLRTILDAGQAEYTLCDAGGVSENVLDHVAHVVRMCLINETSEQ